MRNPSVFSGSQPAAYDRFLGPLFFEPYARDLAGRLPDGSFSQLLELACGTGRLTRHLLPKLAPEGRLYATDASPAMLAVAQEQLCDARIHWLPLDAHHLPFDANSMDAVLCQFGVMFFAQKATAFREAYRVLKPGGRFVFNSWDALAHNALSHEARQVMAAVFPNHAPPVEEKGPYSFWKKTAIRKLVTKAGFTHLAMETLPLLGWAASADDCLRGLVEGTAIGSFLQGQGLSANQLTEPLRERLAHYRAGEGYRLPMQALVCSAEKQERL